ncbi:SubName: Full=Uncharacterized protein {ECO:0000313/EMBL:CCA76219.1} [Serendipita indica DSM 11827]|nr:SubName: Full=Uncharacterized protein {ECO:0000313/EMBL:CCA76219.1} [Serendipita indica DSM 11827]
MALYGILSFRQSNITELRPIRLWITSKPGPSGVEMELLTTHLENIKIVQYVSIASAVVYSYDFALTFGAETQFLWMKRSGRIGRYLFLFTRYSPVIGLSLGLIELNPFTARLSDQTYVKFPTHVSGLQSDHHYCSDSNVSLFNRDVLSSSFFYLSVIIQVVTGAIAISSAITLMGFRETVCAFTGPPPKELHRMVAGYFLSVLHLKIRELPFEILILVATYLHATEAKRKHFLNHESAALLILRRMYQDGAIYFLLAFGMRLGGAIIWLAFPPDLKFVSDLLIYSLSSVVSTRFFLGLRRLVPRPIVQTHHPTPEGSLFVDTYSLPIAKSRNTHPHLSEGVNLSVMPPRGSKDACLPKDAEHVLGGIMTQFDCH